MKMKKIYTAPALEVIDFEAEIMLTVSNTQVDVYDKEETEDGYGGGSFGDANMSNKKKPWYHTWE
jgi:hypothetical protein